MKMYKKVMAAALAAGLAGCGASNNNNTCPLQHLQQMMTAIFSKPQMKIPNHPTMIW